MLSFASKTNYKYLILCFLFLSASSATVKAVEPIPHSHLISFWIKDLATGKVTEHNSQTSMLPASTQKLFTAAAAVKLLGNDFKFETQAKITSPATKGKLTGDLYITFSGDPTLTRDDLTQLITDINNAGINSITGDIILVGDSDEQLRASGWLWDDLGFCYAAPISSYNLDKNCLHGKLYSDKTSSNIHIKFPQNTPVSITSTAKFDAQEAFCELHMERKFNNSYLLYGCLPQKTQFSLKVAVNSPAHYMKSIMPLLIKNKIKLAGNIVTTDIHPKKATVIASHQSQPLPVLLKIMLEKSNNFIADSLFKELGRAAYKVKPSFSSGALALKQQLTYDGVNFDKNKVLDGSGLSRYNAATAESLAQVLDLILATPDMQPLIKMLPLAGISGTLKWRAHFTKTPLKGRVLAKTGSMQGVKTLAGFILDPQNQPRFSFVILENGLYKPKSKNNATPYSIKLLKELAIESNKPVKQ